MRSYNLFRLKSVEGLCCAVPEASRVPLFLGGGRWTFGGRLDGDSDVPLDFDGRAAETGVRFNGFYLFQTVDRRFIEGEPASGALDAQAAADSRIAASIP